MEIDIFRGAGWADTDERMKKSFVLWEAFERDALMLKSNGLHGKRFALRAAIHMFTENYWEQAMVRDYLVRNKDLLLF